MVGEKWQSDGVSVVMRLLNSVELARASEKRRQDFSYGSRPRETTLRIRRPSAAAATKRPRPTSQRSPTGIDDLDLGSFYKWSLIFLPAAVFKFPTDDPRSSAYSLFEWIINWIIEKALNHVFRETRPCILVMSYLYTNLGVDMTQISTKIDGIPISGSPTSESLQPLVFIRNTFST